MDIKKTSLDEIKDKTETWFQKYLAIPIGLVILFQAYGEYVYAGFDFSKWDALFFTGMITYMVIVLIAQTTPARIEYTIRRLSSRGVIQKQGRNLSTKSENVFFEHVKKGYMRSAWIGGFSIAVVILITFIAAFGIDEVVRYKLAFTILATLLGFVAGYYAGMMVYAGRLKSVFSAEKLELTILPGHLDDAAGLKPLGDLYFFQATLLALIALFLGIWWMVINFSNFYHLRYGNWQNPYLWLLILAILFEITAFLLPLWTFHKEMVVQKNEYFETADKLGARIVEVQSKLADLKNEEERPKLKSQLDDMTQQYWAIEQMPTWPIDSKLRRRFTINNAVLSVPFFLDLLGGAFDWKKLREVLDALS